MKKIIFRVISALLLTTTSLSSLAEDGNSLWLNYQPIKDINLRNEWSGYLSKVSLVGSKFDEAIKSELTSAAKEMIGTTINFSDIGSKYSILYVKGAGYGVSTTELDALTDEGYMIRYIDNGCKSTIVVQSAADAGLLYATFHLIKEVRCGISPQKIDVKEQPKLNIRLLNHWASIWGDYSVTPNGNTFKKYMAYARANASIGINGMVLNNVNADPRLMREDYLKKIAVLANMFRKYNIKIYLSANFGACMKPSDTPDLAKKWGGIGNLDTADPIDENVIKWWQAKFDEIYSYIPNFGGILVKADSERMPGPQKYNRTHAQGANMLARALKPHNGIVMWRSFVYNPDADPDRAKRAYIEFTPLDGKFDDNVIIQTKNGPIDFQPAEPVLPLFGAMPNTTMMPEFEIAQEYTGQDKQLVYLLPMWREFFDFDTYCKGKGSTVAKLCQGDIFESNYSKYRAIAGVSNIKNAAENWTGHHFAQANWYLFGRLAWNPMTDSDQITDQWILQTWNCDMATAAVIKQMMTGTLAAFANSNNPYGIGITVNEPAHYGPDFIKRAVAYIIANKNGIGNNRIKTGSNYVSQYLEPNATMFNGITTCPKPLLLFFNFLPWSYKMESGMTLKEDLAVMFRSNINKVEENIVLWESIKDKIDAQRYDEVLSKLYLQRADAEVYYQDAMNFLTVMTQ